MSNPGNFIWYELLTSDAQAAERFYSDVIGWNAQELGQSGHEIYAFDREPGTGGRAYGPI